MSQKAASRVISRYATFQTKSSQIDSLTVLWTDFWELKASGLCCSEARINSKLKNNFFVQFEIIQTQNRTGQAIYRKSLHTFRRLKSKIVAYPGLAQLI